MKIFVAAALSVMFMASVASAQCNCGAQYRPAVSVAPISKPAPAPIYSFVPLPDPVVTQAPPKVAFVNKLENPIPRQNYTLNYAIHLTDGRILLSDVLPKGYEATGVEPGGYNGRKVTATKTPDSIKVVDPLTKQTIATLTDK